MIEQKDYVFAVDYYSGYFEVDQLKKKTARAVIKRLNVTSQTMEYPTFFRPTVAPFI